MSILESIQKAPWDREAELEQLRAIAKEQHEALKHAQICVALVISIDMDNAQEGSAADLIAKAISKYEAMK